MSALHDELVFENTLAEAKLLVKALDSSKLGYELKTALLQKR